MPRTKNIGGKVYKLSQIHFFTETLVNDGLTKADADKEVQYVRATGYLARTVKGSNERYYVYKAVPKGTTEEKLLKAAEKRFIEGWYK